MRTSLHSAALMPALLVAMLFSLVPCTAQARQDTPAATASPAAPDEALSDFSEAEYGESAPLLRDLAAQKNKTVVLIFDISGSMVGAKMMPRAREAAVNVVREGVRPGDRIALFTFGAGFQKVFDTKLESNADKAELVSQVPTSTGQGAGTNIRKAHHEALKIINAGLPNPGYTILITDSFNDEPKKDDPSYPDYLRYYTPGGQLTKYPRTEENQQYERLLERLKQSGKLKQYGIGIEVAENGRPIERLPKAAPDPVEATPTPSVVTLPPPRGSGSSLPLPLLLGLGGLAVLAVLGYVLFAPPKPMPLRISSGERAGTKPKDFLVKAGQPLRIGGQGAGASFDAFPIPGTSEAVATLRAGRGGLFLAPGASGSNVNGSPRVYLNGLPLEKESAVRYGDEVRVTLTPEGGVAKEYRLKLEDPKKSF